VNFKQGGGVDLNPNSANNTTQNAKRSKKNEKTSNHNFGKVMMTIPSPNMSRSDTLTIALPGSIVNNAQTKELKTYIVGQIARAASIYHVDEIVVFDDKLGKRSKTTAGMSNESGSETNPNKNDNLFMARILQYCECPQYLRRGFFPMSSDLNAAGVINPIDAPHHVRAGERSTFREGIVLDKKNPSTGNSLVNAGVKKDVEVNMPLEAGMRVTVEIEDYDAKNIKGTVVSPSEPTLRDGTYWGYQVRVASSITKIFSECPYPSGYDLKIGTSERGSKSVDDVDFSLPGFKHSLIVFGGVAGIEECVDADDECVHVAGEDAETLFDMWLNVCPLQGSRTIRTEEAVLLTLASLKGDMRKNTQRRYKEEREVVTKQREEAKRAEVKKTAKELVAAGDGSELSSESDSE